MLPRETGQALPQGTGRAAVGGAVRPGGREGGSGPADGAPSDPRGRPHCESGAWSRCTWGTGQASDSPREECALREGKGHAPGTDLSWPREALVARREGAELQREAERGSSMRKMNVAHLRGGNLLQGLR